MPPRAKFRCRATTSISPSTSSCSAARNSTSPKTKWSAPRSRSIRATAKCWPWSPRRRSTRTLDRKSTRLNSSHLGISYAVFCLKKKKKKIKKNKKKKKKNKKKKKKKKKKTQ